MSILGDGLYVVRKGIDFIGNIAKKIKGYIRRKDVQGMRKAVKSGDSNTINRKLGKLFNRIKNRKDSQ